jgi:hypothetical protein
MSETSALLVSPRYAAASAAYDAIVDAHGRDFFSLPTNRCYCGRTFTTGNGVGLHVAAIKRQAERAFDVAIVR